MNVTVFLVIFLLIYTAAFGAVINAASCSQAEVQAAIDVAASGDTVLLPAGSCVWSSTLIITKGVILKGAGQESTIITGNITPANPGNTFEERNYLIVYRPANPALNEPFRLSGFTIDCNNRSGGIMIANWPVAPVRNIRIDHNLVKNAGISSARSVLIGGTIYGVIDNNTFSQNTMAVTSYGSDDDAWQNLVFSFGSSNCIYFEDNTFTSATPFHDAGAASTYCARYNTYNGAASLYPWFDMHGNQPNAHTASMGTEIYGNVLNLGSSGYGTGIFDQRGGKAVIFNNNANTSGSVSEKVREEYDDAIYPPAFGPQGQPQHVSDSYFWNNRKNGATLVNAYIDGDYFNRAQGIVNDPPVIVENVTHFNHNTSFDGTTGVGCGPMASRPSTCTAGVGYWATAQSCNSADQANIGDHPKEPLSGTLYKCTATNTWTTYFTPYAYPHPLRVSGPLADESPILYGDVSENGSVTAYDASIAVQYAVGLVTLTQAQITKAEVSGNGSVTSYDASLIAQYAVGLITGFPVEG